jgi:acyl-CoA synthetase (AMP-forming)/AMP-acid ligase II
MKMLPPGAFPLLRYSLFVGEPLTVASAAEWQAAAPVSVVDNLYGPTEATVVCLGQRFCDSSPITRGRATVAIGAPFRGTEAAIVDGELRFLPAGDEGELVLSGPQLARGYLGDPAQTSARFPTIGGRTWYRTGDLAYRDLGGAFHHLGRMDHQVKVLGNRIELEDVEAHLRAVCGCDLVAAVAWPLEEGSARGIVAFVSGTTRSSREIAEGMRRRVPAYMVPSRVEHVESLPLGATGKIDRAALARRLEKSAPGRS